MNIYRFVLSCSRRQNFFCLWCFCFWCPALHSACLHVAYRVRLIHCSTEALVIITERERKSLLLFYLLECLHTCIIWVNVEEAVSKNDCWSHLFKLRLDFLLSLNRWQGKGNLKPVLTLLFHLVKV